MTRYITLAEYFWLAEQVTGVPAAVLVKAARADLADSALHAPAAGFGDEDFYPDLHDKAAVLVCRLAWNHPLVDGNKRAAWASLVMFVELNGGRWNPDPPDVDQQRQRCSRLPVPRLTKPGSQLGCVNAFCSTTEHRSPVYRRFGRVSDLDRVCDAARATLNLDRC